MQYQIRKLFRLDWQKMYMLSRAGPPLKLVSTKEYRLDHPWHMLWLDVRDIIGYLADFSRWLGLNHSDTTPGPQKILARLQIYHQLTKKVKSKLRAACVGWIIATNLDWIAIFDQRKLLAYLKHDSEGRILSSGIVGYETEFGIIHRKNDSSRALVIESGDYTFSRRKYFLEVKNRQNKDRYTYTYNHGQIRLFRMIRGGGSGYPLNKFRLWALQRFFGKNLAQIIMLKLMWSKQVASNLTDELSEPRLLFLADWIYTGHWVELLPKFINTQQYRLAEVVIRRHRKQVDLTEIRELITFKLNYYLTIQADELRNPKLKCTSLDELAKWISHLTTLNSISF